MAYNCVKNSHQSMHSICIHVCTRNLVHTPVKTFEHLHLKCIYFKLLCALFKAILRDPGADSWGKMKKQSGKIGATKVYKNIDTA